MDRVKTHAGETHRLEREVLPNGKLIRAGWLITKISGANTAEVIRDGAVVVSGATIADVGNFSDLRSRNPALPIFGGPDYYGLPGLINNHFHVGLSPFQLGAPDLPMELRQLARMGEQRVDPYLEHSYAAVQLIETGTTAVHVLNYTPKGIPPIDLELARRVIRAYTDAGLRVAYGFNLLDRNGLAAGPTGGEDEFLRYLPADLVSHYKSVSRITNRPVAETIELARSLLAEYNDHPRVRITLAPSSPERCSDELLLAVRELGVHFRAPIHIHLLESIYQRRFGEAVWGKTPLRHLDDLGLLSPQMTCGHSVWLTEPDLEILAESGAKVCLNTSSNLRLYSGIAPLQRMHELDIDVVLGTDEAGLNDDKDLLQEMRLVSTLHRLPGQTWPGPSAFEVLRMATELGAAACGFGERVGTLEPGKAADVVLLSSGRIREPYLSPTVSAVDAIVRRARGCDVDFVMIDGEIVMQDGLIRTLDRAEVVGDIAHALESGSRDALLTSLGNKLIPYMRTFLADGGGTGALNSYYHFNSQD